MKTKNLRYVKCFNIGILMYEIRRKEKYNIYLQSRFHELILFKLNSKWEPILIELKYNVSNDNDYLKSLISLNEN